jgi:hypothetical protein
MKAAFPAEPCLIPRAGCLSPDQRQGSLPFAPLPSIDRAIWLRLINRRFLFFLYPFALEDEPCKDTKLRQPRRRRWRRRSPRGKAQLPTICRMPND